MLGAQLLHLSELATSDKRGQHVRGSALQRVADACGSAVTMFGSSKSGLALPTSDVDVHVKSSGGPGMSEVDELERIGNRLMEAGVVADVAVIARAKIPILRFVETQSQLPFDLNVQSGMALSEPWTQHALQHYSSLRPVVLALKILLKQRALNDTYTGGVSSYLLLVMVHAVAEANEDPGDPGNLLLAVLDRYAANQSHAQRICLRDPARSPDEVFIGENAFRYRAVAQVFQDALGRLKQHACLSAMLTGWPVQGVLTSQEQLTMLLMEPNITVTVVDAEEREAITLERQDKLQAVGRDERQRAHEERQRVQVIRSVLDHLVSRVAKEAEHEERQTQQAVAAALERLLRMVEHMVQTPPRGNSSETQQAVAAALERLLRRVEHTVQTPPRGPKRRRAAHKASNSQSSSATGSSGTRQPRPKRSKQLCFRWAKRGTCSFGVSCRFAHDSSCR